MGHRIDALRSFDKRRSLMELGLPQPLQIDDWDNEGGDSVRNLYADPEESPVPRHVETDPEAPPGLHSPLHSVPETSPVPREQIPSPSISDTSVLLQSHDRSPVRVPLPSSHLPLSPRLIETANQGEDPH